MKIVYFHRNKAAGFSINKVTQTIVKTIDNKEEFYMPYHGAGIKDIVGNLWFIYKHRNKNAINHITGDIHYGVLALWGCRSVLTIHDTVLLDYTKTNKIKRSIYKLFWYTLPLKFAKKIICISHSTKSSLERLSNRKDFIVIHNSTDIEIPPNASSGTNKIPRILFIGTNPNKNLIRCFEALKGIDCTISIIGVITEEQKHVLQSLDIKYTVRYNLSDKEIIEEYLKCDIVSFISLFEGFGMPVIESNAIGKPVIASNIPVLKEIGGDSIHYVDPYDIADIHSGYELLIKDINYRKKLVNKGYVNVKRFDIEAIRDQWLKVYNSF